VFPVVLMPEIYIGVAFASAAVMFSSLEMKMKRGV
jgi:uncharacterized membrane protein YeiH